MSTDDIPKEIVDEKNKLKKKNPNLKPVNCDEMVWFFTHLKLNIPYRAQEYMFGVNRQTLNNAFHRCRVQMTKYFVPKYLCLGSHSQCIRAQLIFDDTFLQF